MSLTFHPAHYAVFKAADKHVEWAGSRKLRSWAASIGAAREFWVRLPDERVDREYLKRICSDESFSAEHCFLAIMAWGGMKVSHGERAWCVREQWAGIIETLRSGVLSRREAYDLLWQFRRANPRCGMGPAYYTKLIFFADPRHEGYIMDQWTSLGINLLISGTEPIVTMTSGMSRGRRYDRVSDSNSAATYERFCLAVEQLGRELDQPAEMIEERLFSSGGRSSTSGEWRDYVKANRGA